jgi:uncharacterized protein YjbI with pentapeptide repeats
MTANQVFIALAWRTGLFIVGVGLGGVIFTGDDRYLANVFLHVLSIITIVLIADFLIDSRLKLNKIQYDREKVSVRQAEAIAELRSASSPAERAPILQRMIMDNLLQAADMREIQLDGAELSRVHLEGVTLFAAKLRGASFTHAHLHSADLAYADLSQAYISNADLTQADLRGATLADCDLWETKLQGAYMVHADLSHADLRGADLKGANLRNAVLDQTVWKYDVTRTTLIATLPDGTQWTTETDMARFTDPTHPDFHNTVDKINVFRLELGIASIPTI